MNLFLTGVRIVQTQGEAAARLWYASLTSAEKERLASETTTANAAAVNAFVSVTETINQAMRDTLTAWQTFTEEWNVSATTPRLPESPSSSSQAPLPTETE